MLNNVFNDIIMFKYAQRFIGKNFMNNGFTLAETLITLGIIGIIAAVTIPVLNSKTKQKVIEVKFAKIYSDLNKAFNAGAIENNEEYFMMSWQLPHDTYIEYVYKNYLKPHMNIIADVSYGELSKKYNATNPDKVFWVFSKHIFIIDTRTFIEIGSDGKTFYIVLLDNDKFDFTNVKDGVNRFSLGTPFCCNNDKCANISNCPNHNLKPIAAWADYSTEELVRLCKGGKSIAWRGDKIGFCTQSLIQNNFKFPKNYPFKF